jgi:hypothetical protein
MQIIYVSAGNKDNSEQQRVIIFVEFNAADVVVGVKYSEYIPTRQTTTVNK